MPLSPAAAAKIAGVSRPLISKAIKSGDLRATLKNNGHQSIEQADLDEWLSRRTERAKATPDAPAQPKQTPESENADRLAAVEKELAATREAVARLEGEASATAARLADLAAERDRLAGLLDKALQPKPGIIARIFGR